MLFPEGPSLITFLFFMGAGAIAIGGRARMAGMGGAARMGAARMPTAHMPTIALRIPRIPRFTTREAFGRQSLGQ